MRKPMSHRSVAVVVTVGLVAMMSPVAAPKANAAFAGPNGLIAFQRQDAAGEQIWVMTPNGSGQVRLTSTGSNTQPAWSADGTKIAFVSDRDGNAGGNAEIYVMNANGSGQTRLTNGPSREGSPAWSPDGQRIVFHSNTLPSEDNDIWVMDADGSDPTNLTNHAADDRYPAWRPDGSTIAFQTDRDGDYEIYSMDTAGSGLENLTDHASADQLPDWSPDGTRLAFVSTRDGNPSPKVYVMNADGSGQTNVTNSLPLVIDDTPSWSPDGTKLAFSSVRNGTQEIYTLDVNGTALRRLTINTDLDLFPDWQAGALTPLCDMTVSAVGGQPEDDELDVSIGQEFEVVGTGYPAEQVIDLELLYLPTGDTFALAVLSDSAGGFFAVFYFGPFSEGSWTMTSSYPVPSVCRDEVHLEVVSGHPFTDIAGHPFEGEIAWLYQRGITTGCTPTTFCPNASVTREQMASFLVRALDLPPTDEDFFVDDETSTHESNINRLAASGITQGCATQRFCPKAVVTREQMASFLARAFQLPATSDDFFVDDETSTHESNINRLAASGITSGCAAARYCPKAVVTRGQMAAFLERALFSVGTSSTTSTADAGVSDLTRDGVRIQVGVTR